jgi:hypothetical protein
MRQPAFAPSPAVTDRWTQPVIPNPAPCR